MANSWRETETGSLILEDEQGPLMCIIVNSFGAIKAVEGAEMYHAHYRVAKLSPLEILSFLPVFSRALAYQRIAGRLEFDVAFFDQSERRALTIARDEIVRRIKCADVEIGYLTNDPQKARSLPPYDAALAELRRKRDAYVIGLANLNEVLSPQEPAPAPAVPANGWTLGDGTMSLTVGGVIVHRIEEHELRWIEVSHDPHGLVYSHPVWVAKTYPGTFDEFWKFWVYVTNVPAGQENLRRTWEACERILKEKLGHRWCHRADALPGDLPDRRQGDLPDRRQGDLDTLNAAAGFVVPAGMVEVRFPKVDLKPADTIEFRVGMPEVEAAQMPKAVPIIKHPDSIIHELAGDQKARDELYDICNQINRLARRLEVFQSSPAIDKGLARLIEACMWVRRAAHDRLDKEAEMVNG